MSFGSRFESINIYDRRRKEFFRMVMECLGSGAVYVPLTSIVVTAWGWGQIDYPSVELVRQSAGGKFLISIITIPHYWE